jgi:hypothetical protein
MARKSNNNKIPAVGSKAQVWKGHAKHTSGGLKKADILRLPAGKDKKGKIKYRYVSKRKHLRAKRLYRDGLAGVTEKGLGAHRRRLGMPSQKGVPVRQQLLPSKK